MLRELSVHHIGTSTSHEIVTVVVSGEIADTRGCHSLSKSIIAIYGCVGL